MTRIFLMRSSRKANTRCCISWKRMVPSGDVSTPSKMSLTSSFDNCGMRPLPRFDFIRASA